MATKPPVDPAIYARVFEELRDGQDILEELVRRFARPAKLEGGIDAVLATYHRDGARSVRSEEHTSELQSLMRNSYAVFCLTKKKTYYTQLEHKIKTVLIGNTD